MSQCYWKQHLFNIQNTKTNSESASIFLFISINVNETLDPKKTYILKASSI